MSGIVQVLNINLGSDGDGRKWPKHHYVRNDRYYLERIAQEWIKNMPGGPQPGVTYRLDKMPHGYAGFEKARADSKHVDRYIYGHPNGQFRSLTEFYPHFQHLMDHGGSNGCTCRLCLGGPGKKSKGASGSTSRDASESRTVRARTAAKPAQAQGQSFDNQQPTSKRDGRFELDAPLPQKRKLVDAEGVPDIYELMIERLRAAVPETMIDEPIEERMSPDWRTGNTESNALLHKWKALPRFVPRIGEIVLFTRMLKDGETIVWNAEDGDLASFRVFDKSTNELDDNPNWEVGIVTQMPEEPIVDQDLLDDSAKKHAVNDSGFRVEPLPKPGSEQKPQTRQYTYVPLHLIRPFSFWSECMTGFDYQDFPDTVKHAITVASSFCVIGKYRFKGQWPTLNVFTRGVYIGGELIMPGDTVRLLPRQHDPQDIITDVMVVTSIRLLFVNLDMDDHGILTAPTDTPYQTCVHVSGRVYTLDPTRSFDGVGKVPIDPKSNVLPSGLVKYGQWYHYNDPKDDALRVELPYHRILGRCWEDTAMNAWFGPITIEDPPRPGRAGANAAIGKAMNPYDLDRGLRSIDAARKFSMKHDKRIANGRSWFWADTRIEQLDLHEVNNRSVGEKDTSRSKAQLTKWRTSLKAMDGKKGALEAFQNVRMKETQEEKAKLQSSYGMVAASAQLETETDGATDAEVAGFTEGDEAMVGGDQVGEAEDESQEHGSSPSTPLASTESEDDLLDEMEVDEDTTQRPSTGMVGSSKEMGMSASQAIALSSEDDSDEEETNQLAQKLAKNIRPNDPRLGR